MLYSDYIYAKQIIVIKKLINEIFVMDTDRPN